MFMREINQPVSRREMLLRLSAATSFVGAGGLGSVATGWADEGDDVPDKSRLHHDGKVKSVIFYYCQGGPSQAHTFDPPSYVEDEKLHPFKFTKSGQSGIEICDLFPNLQTVADDLCLIRGGYGAKASHGAAGNYMFRGSNDLGASIGAWVLYGLGTGNPALPGHVCLKGKLPGDDWLGNGGRLRGGDGVLTAGGLPSQLQALVVNDMTDPIPNVKSFYGSQQAQWLEALKQVNGRHAERRLRPADLVARNEVFDTAFRMQTAAPEAFDVSKESADKTIRKRYGLDAKETRTTGAKCLLARRLVERGVRFITIPASNTPMNSGGLNGAWDTHTYKQSIEGIPTLCQSCDLPLTGLIQDLKERGLFDQTLIVWGGEMGRGDSGHLNHNPNSFTWWLAGGGVKGGHVHGASDDKSSSAVEDIVHMRDFHSTILWLAGLDHTKLEFQGKKLDSRCRVIQEVIA